MDEKITKEIQNIFNKYNVRSIYPEKLKEEIKELVKNYSWEERTKLANKYIVENKL